MEPLFEIWSEGFVPGQAMKLGEAKGSSFERACQNLAVRDTAFRQHFNPKSVTFWGSKLFPSLEAAGGQPE